MFLLERNLQTNLHFCCADVSYVQTVVQCYILKTTFLKICQHLRFSGYLKICCYFSISWRLNYFNLIYFLPLNTFFCNDNFLRCIFLLFDELFFFFKFYITVVFNFCIIVTIIISLHFSICVLFLISNFYVCFNLKYFFKPSLICLKFQ